MLVHKPSGLFAAEALLRLADLDTQKLSFNASELGHIQAFVGPRLHWYRQGPFGLGWQPNAKELDNELGKCDQKIGGER